MSRLSPTEQALCDLLREACFGVPFEDRPGLDWQELLREAESQTVVGLIPPRTEEWKKKAAGNLAQSIRVLHAERELVMLLETHDIPLVILKGTSAAVYYPEPVSRSMGDIVSGSCPRCSPPAISGGRRALGSGLRRSAP